MNQTQIQKRLMTEIKFAEFNRLESHSEKTKRVDLILNRLPFSALTVVLEESKMGLLNELHLGETRVKR